MASIHFTFVTPEHTFFEGDVERITCFTKQGQITVLPHHAPLVAELVPGEILVLQNGVPQPLHVSGGFLQVQPDSKVVVLADSAERVMEIDIARAEEAVRKAQEMLVKASSLSEREYAVTAALLERNMSRVRIARKHSRRRTNITNEAVFEE